LTGDLAALLFGPSLFAGAGAGAGAGLGGLGRGGMLEGWGGGAGRAEGPGGAARGTMAPTAEAARELEALGAQIFSPDAGGEGAGDGAAGGGARALPWEFLAGADDVKEEASARARDARGGGARRGGACPPKTGGRGEGRGVSD
jgi:hypothetical protein